MNKTNQINQINQFCSLRGGRSYDTIHPCDTALFRAQPL
jgi:hypothetical protein